MDHRRIDGAVTIPLNTSTITVTRIEDASTTDPYDPAADHPAPTTIASGVRAVISPPSGTAKLVGGDRVVYEAALRCDTTAILPGDVVVDSGGLTWTVLFASQISALGMTFTSGKLRLVTGAT